MAIIICITSDSSSGETSYKIRDTYGHIYSTTTRLLLDLTQEKSIPTAKILIQKSVLIPLSLTLTTHLNLKLLKRILPLDIQLLLPVIIQVNIPQYLHLHSHMTYHRRSLFQLHNLHQANYLPVDIPQTYHLHSHITYHWRSLSKIHLLQQVTYLPVYITPAYHLQYPLIFLQKNKTSHTSFQQNHLPYF